MTLHFCPYFFTGFSENIINNMNDDGYEEICAYFFAKMTYLLIIYHIECKPVFQNNSANKTKLQVPVHS